MRATRIRIGTYSGRKPINWRVRAQLHENLTAQGIQQGLTSTSLVISLVEQAVRKPASKAQVTRFLKDPAGGELVSVTLRLEPDLAEALKGAAHKAGLSVNRYLTFVVWAGLQPKP